MSGLLGLLERDGGTADETALAAGLEAIEHRGPDGSSVWSDGPVGLGHCLRQTTPHPGGQPHSEGALAVAADARIDNRTVLIESLGLSPTVSDAGVLLAAYREWGRDCPSRLIGAFSFVIWDADEEQLFCARDHAGIRPLFYCADAERFAVASEIGAVLATDGTRPTIDEVRIADYLADVNLEVERTFYSGVRRLPPAHAMAVTTEAIETWRYWSPDPERDLGLSTHEAYAEAFRELLAQAVDCRLEGPGTTGSMLSGGLDSSSIVCLARERMSGDDLPTYSFVFDELAECDEREYIEAVVEGGGVDPTYVDAEARGPLSDVDDLLAWLGTPFTSTNIHLTLGVFDAATEGVDVILDGLGGDHVVSTGMARLAELAAAGRLRALWREVRAVARRAGSRPRGVVARHVVTPLAPDLSIEIYRRFRGVADPLRRSRSSIDPTFADETDVRRRARAQPWFYGWPPNEARRHRSTLEHPQLTYALETIDQLGARFGIEPRFPFLDRRLMAFCVAVPAEHKLRDGWPRAILRTGMRGMLPEGVRMRRRKANLAPAVPHGLRTHDGARLRGCIDDPRSVLSRFVDRDRFRVAFEALEAGQTDDPGVSLCRPAILAGWLASHDLGEPLAHSDSQTRA